MDDIIEIKLNAGDMFEYKNELFRYLGNIKDPKDLPKCKCCYSIDGTLYVRTIEKPLDLEIKPDDDFLLIEVKKALKDFTPSQFRNLFDTEYEYRNMRRVIEKSNLITISRFENIMGKLGFDKSKILDIIATKYYKHTYKCAFRYVNYLTEEAISKWKKVKE